MPQTTAGKRRTHNDDEAMDRETKLQTTLASARDVIGTAGEDERTASAVLLILIENGAERARLIDTASQLGQQPPLREN